MAHLVVDGDSVQLKLSLLEVLGAFRLSPVIKVNQIESIEIVENPWSSEVLKGMRIGTGIPFVALLGVMKYVGGKDFCIIYKRRPNAVITLKSGPFKRWIFEIKDFQEVDALKKAIQPSK
jgi:hypothetical protein